MWFSKAFDKVSHANIINKLHQLGFDEQLLGLFSSYLKNRYQSYVYNDCHSSLYQTTCDMPQGSHLGVLLLLYFINDLAALLAVADDLMFI
nr:unnamed protein product [Callosobruchus chinensis]CAH7752246.1 unnamed protein product [Callosobruchus chinensis]